MKKEIKMNNQQATKAAASLVSAAFDVDRPANVSQPFRTPSTLVKTQKMIRKLYQFFFGIIMGFSFTSPIT